MKSLCAIQNDVTRRKKAEGTAEKTNLQKSREDSPSTEYLQHTPPFVCCNKTMKAILTSEKDNKSFKEQVFWCDVCGRVLKFLEQKNCWSQPIWYVPTQALTVEAIKKVLDTK